MKIDVFTFLTKNSADYAEFLKYTCDKFKSNKHEINWKCIESVGCKKIPEGYKLVGKTGDVDHNSMNHALALNEAQKYIENDYIIFIDSDMAILHKNWDDIIIKELNTYDCFGGSYYHILKYENFPTVYLFAFRRHILNKVKLDFSPKIKEGSESPCKYLLENEHEIKLFGKRKHSVIKCDTGWKLPLIIKGAGFTSNSMPMILMNSKKNQLPFIDKKNKKICMKHPSHMCEWHYNEKLFCTHKQASRNHPLNEGFGLAWKQRVELYIKNLK